MLFSIKFTGVDVLNIFHKCACKIPPQIFSSVAISKSIERIKKLRRSKAENKIGKLVVLKTSSFLMFSGSIEVEYGLEMGQHLIADALL